MGKSIQKRFVYAIFVDYQSIDCLGIIGFVFLINQLVSEI